MVLTQAWYETIFCGALEVGIDREKMYQLEDESFLYLHLTEEQTQQSYEE